MPTLNIDGEFPNLRLPTVDFLGHDVYGVTRKGKVYGPFRYFRFTWAHLKDGEMISIWYRLQGARGRRVTVSIPVASSSSWELFYGEVELNSFRRDGPLAFNVTVDVTRVNDDPDA